VQEAVEVTATMSLDPTGGNALACVGRGTERIGERRVVHERHVRGRDLFTGAPDEHRTAFEHRFTTERRSQQAEQRPGYQRIEDDGKPAGRGLAGTEQPGRPLGRVTPSRGDVEVADRPTHGEPVSGLGLLALAGHRERRDRAHRAPG
jgi:hypothetical protein